MKKLIISILIPAVIIAVAWWYIFNLIPHTVELENWEKHIPKNVGFLMEADAEKLRDILMDEGMSSPSEMKSLVSNMDSLNKKLRVPTGALLEIFNQCLHLPDKLVLFETPFQDTAYFHVLFPLKSRENLDTYLRKTAHTNLGKDNFLLEKERLGILVDKDIVILSLGNDLPFESYQSICNNFLLGNESNQGIEWKGGISTDLNCLVKKNSTLWKYGRSLPFEKIEFSGRNSLGRTRIEFNLFSKDKEEVFKPISKEFETPKSLLNLSIGWNNDLFNFPQIMSEKETENINSYGISYTEIDSIWNGEVAINVQPSETFEEEYITYEYDENFARVEKVETKINLLPVFELFLGTHIPTEALFNEKQWVKEVAGTKDFILYPIQKINYQEIKDGFILRSDSLRGIVNDVNGVRGSGQCDVDNFLINYPHLFDRKTADAIIEYVDDFSFTVQNEKHGGKLVGEIIYQEDRSDGLISIIKLLSSLR